MDNIRLGYKKVVYGRHIVFFKMGNDQVTEIIRGLHASMDIQNRLADQ